MEFQNIIFEVEDGIAVITMNRPKALNALNNETLYELTDAVAYCAKTAEVKGLIITGAGKAFVAGADIVQMKDYGSEQGRDYAGFAQDVFNKIEALEKPVIAAVNGYALGGGCELSMACDIRIAGERAVFGQPEVNLGIIPCFGGTQRLSRLVGAGKAKELIFTTDYIKAEEAEKIGLANKVVAQDTLLDEAKAMMKKILSKAPLAIKYGKVAINKGLDLDLKNALELEKDLVGLCFATDYQKEGMAAFVEKRDATFSSK
ncbi:MAG: enoyl-CoA hydratase [Clostridiales bacterium]|nr:enoyl-CoA hydratase [Clostridiales bacterium]